MTIKAVIFDLDQTLVDTSRAEHLRNSRQWAQVYPMIPTLPVYDGIPQLLVDLDAAGIDVCVVTSSPSTYCKRILQHNGWGIDKVVCYHDTSRRKPHPEPILKGLELLGVAPTETVAIGDAATDTQAARAAGVRSIGAAWGTQHKDLLIASNPDALCYTVEDLRRVLLS